MNKHMRVITNLSEGHETLPDGYACLYMDNHGWVGTGDGNLMGNMPALFPVAQALALAYAWDQAVAGGVKIFSRDVPIEEIKAFKGVALFPFDDSEEVVGWLSPNKQMV